MHSKYYKTGRKLEHGRSCIVILYSMCEVYRLTRIISGPRKPCTLYIFFLYNTLLLCIELRCIVLQRVRFLMGFRLSFSLLILISSKTEECCGTIARNQISLRKIGNGARQETRAQKKSSEQRFFRQGIDVI